MLAFVHQVARDWKSLTTAVKTGVNLEMLRSSLLYRKPFDETRLNHEHRECVVIVVQVS